LMRSEKPHFFATSFFFPVFPVLRQAFCPLSFSKRAGHCLRLPWLHTVFFVRCARRKCVDRASEFYLSSLGFFRVGIDHDPWTGIPISIPFPAFRKTSLSPSSFRALVESELYRLSSLLILVLLFFSLYADSVFGLDGEPPFSLRIQKTLGISGGAMNPYYKRFLSVGPSRETGAPDRRSEFVFPPPEST